MFCKHCPLHIHIYESRLFSFHCYTRGEQKTKVTLLFPFSFFFFKRKKEEENYHPLFVAFGEERLGRGDQSFNIRSKMESNENITLSRDKIK